MSESTAKIDALPFDEHPPTNGKNEATLLLIHGAFVDRHEWDPIVPELSKTFHVLYADLPEHGEAQQLGPFSKTRSADLLADLIRSKASNGQAHVVGFSLGAHVAISLAVRHPDVVKDVFVSGFEVFPSFPLFAYTLWTSQRVENAMPRSFKKWLMDGTDMGSPSASNPVTLQKCRSVAHAMSADDCWPVPWPARTLIMAAGKSGLLPTADHPHDATKLRDIGRRLNEETVAYTHPEMRHPWSIQAPETFVRTVTAWFNRETLPDGFRLL